MQVPPRPMGMASLGSWSFCRQGTMQCVRMAKSIRLIGFVTACLLLCSAQSFEPALLLRIAPFLKKSLTQTYVTSEFSGAILLQGDR